MGKPTLLSFNSTWQASQNLKRQINAMIYAVMRQRGFHRVSVALTSRPHTPPVGSPGRLQGGRGDGRNGPGEERKLKSDLYQREDTDCEN